MWKKYKFKTNIADYRPKMYNSNFPWWKTGGDDESTDITVWLPTEQKLSNYWEDAYSVSHSTHEEIVFTERTPQPEWYNQPFRLTSEYTYYAKHIPTGESWHILGQSYDGHHICASGYPPTIGSLTDMMDWEIAKKITPEEVEHRKTFGDSFDVPMEIKTEVWNDNNTYELYPFQLCMDGNNITEVHNIGPDTKKLVPGDLVGMQIDKTKAIRLIDLTAEHMDQLGFEKDGEKLTHEALSTLDYYIIINPSSECFFLERLTVDAGIPVTYLHELNFLFKLITNTELGFDKFKL